MAEPMMDLSPTKLNSNPIAMHEEDHTVFHEMNSSPFISFVDDDQENVAPTVVPTPIKPLINFDDDVPQSAFKVSPSKTLSDHHVRCPPHRPCACHPGLWSGRDCELMFVSYIRLETDNIQIQVGLSSGNDVFVFTPTTLNATQGSVITFNFSGV